jgi:FtsZ-binding cell division protein ZapB
MSTALSDLYQLKRDELREEQKDLERKIEGLERKIEGLERKIEGLGEGQSRLATWREEILSTCTPAQAEAYRNHWLRVDGGLPPNSSEEN